MEQEMIYKYYRKIDYILFLITISLSILLDIIIIASYLDILFKVIAIFSAFFLQLNSFIYFIIYYIDKDSFIIISNDILKIKMRKKNYEIAVDEITSISFNLISKMTIKTNNKDIVFKMPFFLNDRRFEILNLISKKSNLKENKKHPWFIIRYFEKDD